MTDLHTHILPGMDDGARDVQQSLVMLEQEADQGVKTVALTPHFYPQKETVSDFLTRREEAWQQLKACIAASAENTAIPELCLGAEVAYAPGMWEWAELPQLCYEGTKVLLVELPFSPWNDEMFQELHRILGRRGIMPFIAHLDRYLGCQRSKNLHRLLDMGFPYQTSAAALLKPFSYRARRLWLNGGIPVSDCHDESRRPPNLGQLYSFFEHKYGNATADAFVEQTETWHEF